MKQMIALLLLTVCCTMASLAQGAIEQIRLRLEKAIESANVTEDDLFFGSSLHLRLEDTLQRDITRPYAYKYLNRFLAIKDSIDVRWTGLGLQGTFTYWSHGKKTKLFIDIAYNEQGATGINISRHGLTNLFHDVHQK